jgi:DNA polymerase III delta prime subunit
MRIKELKEFVIKYVSASNSESDKPSLFIWGPPGIGKSATIKQCAKDLGIEMIDVRLSQIAPTDLRGLPFVETSGEQFKFVPPDFLPKDPDSSGILFLDEMNMASPGMMGLAQQLILDRQVGNYTLPHGWTIIAAGNRSGKDFASVSTMPAPVSNRFIHIDVESRPEEYIDYLMDTTADERIISFLKFRESLVWSMPKVASNAGLAWPSPRTWSMANWLLRNDMGVKSVESAVGHAAYVEFYAFMEVWGKIPDVQPILDGHGDTDWQGNDVLNNPSTIYALVGILSNKLKNTTQANNVISFFLTNRNITEDYVGMFIRRTIIKFKKNGRELQKFVKFLSSDNKAKKFLEIYRELNIED